MLRLWQHQQAAGKNQQYHRLNYQQFGIGVLSGYLETWRETRLERADAGNAETVAIIGRGGEI